ncbi:MAG: hypothetical protein AMXMBFR13_22510 [Phycisphaerae bacterium]
MHIGTEQIHQKAPAPREIVVPAFFRYAREYVYEHTNTKPYLRPVGTSWFIGVWLWPVTVALALYPLVVLIRFLRTHRCERRRRRGLCGTCRYDLTANVSGVCPECGTPVPSSQPASSNAAKSG